MKLKLILLFCFLTIAHTRFLKRIVGGIYAEPHSFPNMVAVYGLRTRGRLVTGLFCGGTIYSAKWIATTGDCVSGVGPSCPLETIRVVAGKWNMSIIESFEQERTVELVRKHDGHEQTQVGRSIDLALLKLHHALVFNEFVSAFPFSINMEYPSGSAVIIGWGSSTVTEVARKSVTNILHVLNVEVVPMKACKYAIKKTLLTHGQTFTENSFNIFHFCTGTFTRILRGPFFGDAGGPLMQLNTEGLYEVIGVTSAGFGLPELGVYIHVAPFLEWINSEIARFPDL